MVFVLVCFFELLLTLKYCSGDQHKLLFRIQIGIHFFAFALTSRFAGVWLVMILIWCQSAAKVVACQHREAKINANEQVNRTKETLAQQKQRSWTI